MHVKKIRMVAEERLRRKRTTTQYIMNRVKSMKEELMVTNIPPEHNDVDDSVWITIYARLDMIIMMIKLNTILE